jgi:putative ABC transport system permease protein
MKDILQEIWSTSKHNKLRTALTGFSVAWGIFMLIFLLGEGNGLINAQLLNSDQFLANSMMVGSGSTSKAYNGLKEGRNIALNQRDIATTQHNFNENIDDVGATVSQSGVTINQGDNYVSTSLEGVYPNKIILDKGKLLYGRYINHIDLVQKRKVLVLDKDQAEQLNRDASTLVGKYVNVGNFAFRVVGILKTDQTGRNSSATTSFTTLQAIYSKGDTTNNIEFIFHGLTTEKQNEDFEKTYRARINANHKAAPDDEGALWIWNRFTQNMQMNNGVNIMRTALWIIGLFTLLSGIVGVSNIMLITVKERTREFGIRKAIGASPASILRLIIIESIIITTIFGYIGMIIGIGANQYMDATIGHTQTDTGLFTAVMFLNPTVGLDVCIEATVTLIIAGTIAGLIPARKAARIRPIEALRAE